MQFKWRMPLIILIILLSVKSFGSHLIDETDELVPPQYGSIEKKKEIERKEDFLKEIPITIHPQNNIRQVIPALSETWQQKGNQWMAYRSGLVKMNPKYARDRSDTNNDWEIRYFLEKVHNSTPLFKEIKGNIVLIPEGEKIQENLKRFGGQALYIKELGLLFLKYAMKESSLATAAVSMGVASINTALGSQAEAILAVVSFGETLNLPIGGVGSRFILGTTIALSIIPKTHAMTKNILYLTRKFDEESLIEKRCAEKTPHKIGKKIAAFGPSIRVLVKAASLYALESDNIKGGDILFYVIAAPSVVSEFLFKYNLGQSAINRAFYNQYVDKDIKLKQQIIKRGIDNFLKRINGNKKQDITFCRTMYDELKNRISTQQFNFDEMLTDVKKVEEEVLELTGFFLVHGVQRYKADSWGRDIETLSPVAASKSFFTYVSHTSKALAAYATYEGISFAVENYILGPWFGASTAITYASRAIGTLYTVGEWMNTFYKIKSSSYHSFNPMDNNYSNHRKKRYLARIASGANSALHLWWSVYLAQQGLSRNGMIDYISTPFLLFCLGAHEGIAYDKWFNQHYQKTITHYYLRNMNKNDPTLDDMRNLFDYLGHKLKKEITRLNPEMIQNIYDIGFASHVDDNDDE